MFQDTVTLFQLDEQKEVWYPVVLKDCEAQIKTGMDANENGTQNQDAAKLFITYTLKDNHMQIENKEIITPRQWESRIDKSDCITFKEGDFFAIGDMGNEPLSESAYENGVYEHMRNTMDFVYRIVSVSYYKVIPSIEVGGA